MPGGSAYAEKAAYEIVIKGHLDEKLIGKSIGDFTQQIYDVNSILKDIAKESRLVRLMYCYSEHQQAKQHGRGSIEYRMMMRVY